MTTPDVWDELNAWEPFIVSSIPTYSGEIGSRGVIVGWSVRIGLHGDEMLHGDGDTIPAAIAAAVKAGEKR